MATKRKRTDYFRERRKTVGQFNISISKEKLDKFSELLKNSGITKTEWLNMKIDEELK